MASHRTGTREEWLAARRELLAREKELTRRSDELARERQELPWVKLDKEYAFDTAEGAALDRAPRGRNEQRAEGDPLNVFRRRDVYGG